MRGAGRGRRRSTPSSSPAATTASTICSSSRTSNASPTCAAARWWPMSPTPAGRSCCTKSSSGTASTRGDSAIHEAGAPFRRFEAMRDDKAMAAAILNPPYAIHARRAGLKDMGAVVDTIGPYLGTVPYVLRAWAEANAAHARGLSRGLHRGPALDARSGESGRGDRARRRAPERAGRHRRRNPRGRDRSGARPRPGCRLRPRGLRHRARSSAPTSRAAPPRRRRNISTCPSTGKPSPAFESGAEQGHNAA